MTESSSSSASSKPLIVADPTKGFKVNAGVVAKPFRDEIKAKVEKMKNLGVGTSSILLKNESYLQRRLIDFHRLFPNFV